MYIYISLEGFHMGIYMRKTKSFSCTQNSNLSTKIEINKRLCSSSSKYELYLPWQYSYWSNRISNNLNPYYRNLIKKARPANYPCFGSFCHPDQSIKSTRLWQVCPVKALHFKYFAIILFTLCFVTAYSRKK